MWKSQASHRWARLEELFTSDAVHAIARDFSLRGSRLGQERALKKLRRVFDPLACIQLARVGGRPRALWLALVPRSTPVIVGSDDPGERQSGAATYFVLVGGATQGCTTLDTGLWTLEASDHALHRLIERGGTGAGIDGVLLAAHHRILRDRLHLGADGEELIVSAGPGIFRAARVVGASEATGLPVSFVRAETWLHQDQIADDPAAAASNNQVWSGSPLRGTPCPPRVSSPRFCTKKAQSLKWPDFGAPTTHPRSPVGGYLPLAPGVSTVRYPIPERIFDYVSTVRSATAETCTIAALTR